MTAPRIDESEWPLVTVTSTDDMTPAESDAFFARLRGFTQRRLVYGVVFDSRISARPDAVERRKIAEFMKETAPLASKYSIGTAVVLDSALQRSILTGVLWLFTPPYPIQVVSTVAEGRVWALDRLRQRLAEAAPGATRGPRSPRQGI